MVGGARSGPAGTRSALGEASNRGLGLEVSPRFCPRPEAVEAQRPGSHQRPSGFRSPGTIPSSHGRGLAGLRGQGARVAPARPMGSVRRQLLQPGAGPGARAATHQRAAAGRHQVSGETAGRLAPPPTPPEWPAVVQGCSQFGARGGVRRGPGKREGQRIQASRPRHPTQSPVGALLVVSAARCCEFPIIRHCRIQLTGGMADTVLKRVPCLGTVAFGTLQGSHWGVSSATASEGPSTPPKHPEQPGPVVTGLSSSAGGRRAAVAFEKALHWRVLCLANLPWLQGQVWSSGAALWPSPRSAGSLTKMKDTPY